MDISNRFSLEDFLAYLFPGVTGTLGIYVLLLLTPLQPSLTNFSNDFTTGIIFLVLSYIVGILLSGISEKTFQYYENQSKIKSYKDTIPLRDELRRTVKKAFTETFKLNKETHVEWCKDYFYLCRSLVIQSMPNALSPIQRQSSLRQLRMNLLPSIFIWGGVGIGWGWKAAYEGNRLGIVLLIGSLVLGVLFTILTIDRTRSNEWREVREVLTAFLAGYQTGTFKDKTKS